MKYFGFLSFGHYSNGGRHGITAAESLHQAIDLSVAADELGVNGAFFRVHHFAPQAAAPMPLLSAIASRTKAIEVGTGVIDMRYENPLYLAEEAAALDLIADGRTALGVSRGAPEIANKGWESFGYHSEERNGADLARAHYECFLDAIDGKPMAEAGHDWAPRVSVSRSIFPFLSERDRGLYGLSASGDQVGHIDSGIATFGRTYAADPSTLIKQLSQDRALAEADTLLLTIPNQLGFEENWSIIRNFAEYVAPALGWEPARPGVLPTGYGIDEVVAE